MYVLIIFVALPVISNIDSDVVSIINVSVFVPFAFLVFFLFHGFRDPLTRIDEDLDDICVLWVLDRIDRIDRVGLVG